MCWGWELCGSAEPAPDAQEGARFTLCPTARPPETSKQSQNRAGGGLGRPLCWQVQLSILLMPTLPGCLVLEGGSGPALPGVSCMGQPQGPD